MQTVGIKPVIGCPFPPSFIYLHFTIVRIMPRATTSSSELATHSLKLVSYPNANLVANGTKGNKLAAVTFYWGLSHLNTGARLSMCKPSFPPTKTCKQARVLFPLYQNESWCSRTVLQCRHIGRLLQMRQFKIFRLVINAWWWISLTLDVSSKVHLQSLKDKCASKMICLSDHQIVVFSIFPCASTPRGLQNTIG